ncbi:MAG: D-alanyl-D-alanine carboxypeptidase [Pseudomonadota bacterium]|nr:D-alanyl-D-alanine carboxypeptidase [Pseudomonadota bacterium]
MYKLLSFIVISLFASLGIGTGIAHAQVSPPEIAGKAWILVDMSTGQVLAEHNADERFEPASLTKVMTAYVVFRALTEKRIDPEQRPPVSERAYKAIGSRTFVEPASPARIEDLLRGMIVQSGNDASIILAEAVAGTEEGFAQIMNQTAERMGMTNTQFRNSTGLPAPEHYSTARDLATSAMNLIRDFPEYYPLYSEKSFTYNNIKQGNRNRLLYVDPTVDGMKTGYTEAAGYCLISSAIRPQPGTSIQRRLLSVVLGTASMAARAIESQKLLNYGFQNFDAVEVYATNQAAGSYTVWKGNANVVTGGFEDAVRVSVPKGQAKKVQAEIEHIQPLVAPIVKGQRIGTLRVRYDGELLAERPLLANEDVAAAGILGRLWDSLKMLILRQ